MTMRRIVLLVLIAALIAPLFITAIPPQFEMDRAGKIFTALALVLPLLGTVALHDAIFERKSWWPLCSAVIVYNAALITGDLDFLIGAGLTFLGTACWLRLKAKPWVQTVVVALLAEAFFVIHFDGVGFLFVIIGGYEISEAWRKRQLAALAPRAMYLALAALPVFALYFQTHLPASAYTSPGHVVKSMWWALNRFDPFAKAIGAGAEFFTYDSGIDLLILIAVAAAFGALALGKKLAFSWLAPIAAALYVIYPFVSGSASTAGQVDIRLPVLAGFLLFAGITPRKLGRRETTVLTVAFAALIIARLGVIATAWQGQNADLATNAAPMTAQISGAQMTAEISSSPFAP
jgi:hypothetical protein